MRDPFRADLLPEYGCPKVPFLFFRFESHARALGPGLINSPTDIGVVWVLVGSWFVLLFALEMLRENILIIRLILSVVDTLSG